MITVASCGELKKRFEHLLHETFYENRCWRSIFVSRFPGGCARTLYSEAPCGKKYLINVTESTSSRIKVNITCLSVSPSLSRQHSFSIINPLLSLMPLPPVLLLFALPPIAN